MFRLCVRRIPAFLSATLPVGFDEAVAKIMEKPLRSANTLKPKVRETEVLYGAQEAAVLGG